MPMFSLIADGVIILTLAVIALSVLAVINRYRSDIRESRVRRLRLRMQDCLNEFLSGPVDEQAAIAIRELEQDRDIALGVLVSTASRVSRKARSQLRMLFLHFQFPQQEIAALGSRRWSQRVSAATRLGYMGYDGAVPALIKALDDDMLDVRLSAAHALAQMEAVHAVQPILRTLALPAAWPLQRCAEILHEMGDGIIDPLLDVLREPEPRPASAWLVAVRVLGMLRAQRAVGLVMGFVDNADPELRLCSAKALGQIGDRQAVPALCRALEDKSWRVRSAAARALGELDDQAAVLPLQQRLSDEAWWARFNAAESLSRLGESGLSALKDAMSGHPDSFARDICRQILEERGVIPMREVTAA